MAQLRVFVKRLFLSVIIFIVFLIVTTFVILTDLHYLGDKTEWTNFDRGRVKLYCNSIVLVGTSIPPIKQFSIIHHSAILAEAYLNKKLPSFKSMRFLRRLVFGAYDSNNKTNSFSNELLAHEKYALKYFKLNGTQRFVKEIKQRVALNLFGFTIYDDWMILICTDIYKGKPKTSFLIWGLGIVWDKQSTQFFGTQLGFFGKLIPFNIFDAIEREGLAKGYWVLLTESDETSEFSYEARNASPQSRKQNWLSKIK